MFCVQSMSFHDKYVFPTHLFYKLNVVITHTYFCVQEVQQLRNRLPTLDLVLSNTVELHLSRLIGAASHSGMQKISIVRFFFENRPQRQFEVKKNSTNGYFRLHIYLCTNKTLIHNSFYVFDKWRENIIHEKCSTITVRKCLPEGPSRSK
jgi:hypothetical protein